MVSAIVAARRHSRLGLSAENSMRDSVCKLHGDFSRLRRVRCPHEHLRGERASWTVRRAPADFGRRQPIDPAMLRLGAIFTAGCMILIAVSTATALYLAAGLGGAESTVIALAALTGLALYNAVTTRLRDRSDLGGQIADLSRGTADLARQVAELARRTAAMEEQGRRLADDAADSARKAAEPISAELGELDALVKRLADSVASHETRLSEIASTASSVSAGPAAPTKPGLTEPRGNSTDEFVNAVHRAVESNRVDLYLQPIVTLPQRKVRYYEAVMRLRTDDGKEWQPSDILDPPIAAALTPRIDNLLVLRCVQVVRRLQVQNREIGLFCGISLDTLRDPEGFSELSHFLEANRALASSLLLGFKQSAWRAMGPAEHERLAVLRDQGFWFCIDQVVDLRMEPRDLAHRGVRFVKVPTKLLLGAAAPAAEVHAAELSELMARFAISLIADMIEAEAQVVGLLDYDVRFGQGLLFSPARPVRADALHGAAERAKASARPSVDNPRDQPAASTSAGAAL
jgi:cyclic-di-GMP phosphodiesterase TipF (flagellum assembly factor)